MSQYAKVVIEKFVELWWYLWDPIRSLKEITETRVTFDMIEHYLLDVSFEEVLYCKDSDIREMFFTDEVKLFQRWFMDCSIEERKFWKMVSTFEWEPFQLIYMNSDLFDWSEIE